MVRSVSSESWEGERGKAHPRREREGEVFVFDAVEREDVHVSASLKEG